MSAIKNQGVLFMNEYQEEAMRTANMNLAHDRQLMVWTLGLVGEAGEVAELVKKHMGHGHQLNKEALTKELGDVLWYIAAVARLNDISLEDIATGNLDKLGKRYPGGFSEARSRTRDEEVDK